jgi:hypothetical protein
VLAVVQCEMLLEVLTFMERSTFQLLLDNIQSHHCHVPAKMSFRSICIAHMGSTNSGKAILRTQVHRCSCETDPRAEVLALLRLR